MVFARTAALLLAAGLAGCAHQLRDLAVSAPARVCADPAVPDGGHCMPVARIEGLFRDGAFVFLDLQDTPSGTSDVQRARVAFDAPDGGAPIVLFAKWKVASHKGDAMNNSPRRELAAYRMQALYLDEGDYVVPVTVARCVPLDAYQRLVPDAEPTLDGTGCVLGVLSYWLSGVTSDWELDLDRFARDPAYRRRMALLNVHTYVIDHRDTRPANFLLRAAAADPRAFDVDNSLAFSGLRNPIAAFIGDWSDLRVPSLPRPVVARLRAIRRADLDAFGVVAQYDTRDGMLVEVPPGPNLDPDEGFRRRDGAVQLGLTRDEIDAVAQRIGDLLARVDAGEVGLF